MYDPTKFDFKGFAGSVASNLSDMMKNHDRLLRANITGDDLWAIYLGSFPEGTNPIFRERTHHDGNYDKNFIRRVGNVVAIENGVIRTIWDVSAASFPYDVVSAALADKVRSAAIAGMFRIEDGAVGHEPNFEFVEGTGRRLTWNHFHSVITAPHKTPNAASEIGKLNSKMGVYRRGLNEIAPAAVEVVLDLINDNNLHRGQEYKASLVDFQKSQTRYLSLTEAARDIFIWSTRINDIRNTVIGTLLVDISEGVDLTVAVAKFENKVSGTNFKRSKSLITEGMVKKAFEKIDELGLRDSLERRHAKLSDVSVNDVLWVDRGKASALRDSLMDTMLSSTKPTKTSGKAVDILLTDFMKDVAPGAESMDLLFEGKHQNRLMSVTAPIHSGIEPLFQWGNDFAWAYNGDVADSVIAKLVAAKGGNIKAALRVSLAWKNHDDYDFHAKCPDGHIYFSNKAGILDVDENAGGGKTRTPVENFAWTNPRDGKYEISVHNFCNRESSDYGFTIEMEVNGTITTFSYPKFISDKATINAISFSMKGGQVSDIKILNKDIVSSAMPQDIWGLTTEKYCKVNTILASPNFWEGTGSDRGNRHTFFILENAKNPEPCRGMYNEFLRSELSPYRKVFEILGSKTKVPYSDDQLSGVGFSSTQSADFIVKVTKGGSTREYRVLV